MAFDATFRDLRARRRIPMRLFTERFGMNPSYIYSIESEKLLPGPEKLEKLVSLFVSVAEEQGAADPQEDARILYRERERTELIDRLGFEPDLAEALISLRQLDPVARAELIRPMAGAIDLAGDLERKQRQGVATLLDECVRTLACLEEDEREAAGWYLAVVMGRALQRIKDGDPVVAEARQIPDELPESVKDPVGDSG